VKAGIVILSELHGPVRERILAIQQRFDPKLARMLPPHVTITGSSGIGPIAARTTVAELRKALEPVALETPPMELPVLRPMRFMQSQVVVLPMDPHGAIRELHDRIQRSGLRYEQPRFTFTPHITLNLFRELPDDELRELLAVRIDETVVIDRIAAYRTENITGTRRMIELTLGAGHRAVRQED
jgi:2'-5' RNA ligase